MTSFPEKADGSVSWRPSTEEIEAIVTGRHGDAFSVLGPHKSADGRISVRLFEPEADIAEIIANDTGEKLITLERLHDDGFFAGIFPADIASPKYKVRFTKGDHQWDREDPYRFPPYLGETDVYLIAEGTHKRLYQMLGAHPFAIDGIYGVVFAVWAPNAERVSVVGDFNGWDGRRHLMRKRIESGVWELFIPDVARDSHYKFEILGQDGKLLPLKADPLSFSQEIPPSTASLAHGLVEYDWTDHDWLTRRNVVHDRSSAISIYEVHLGSWRRGEGNVNFDYDRLASELVAYVTDLGFTHIELLPISEHPFTGSWGYQPIGLFAPTARFGPPEAFARFVDYCHQAGIGVIVDWVPGHFPTDPHGLVRFDGTSLYEHDDPRLGFHQDWNTLVYNFGRREVANFLEANALFWLDRYHVDGLRVDAVASMLYLDYSRKPGEWVPNIHGGRENLEAISFLRQMNTIVYDEFPGTFTAAEESTAWPKVSRPIDEGGLGFGFKWNMGWMHDTLAYMTRDPVHRRHHHSQMTFGIQYAFSENFILPLSHDEVVHGKGSLLGKMPGDRWQKFANLRAYLAFMWTHPGKKLLFMGGEFAQEREWNHDASLDWHLIAEPQHRGVQALVRDLNKLYLATPSLYELDCEAEGFEWIEADDANRSVLAYLRRGRNDSKPVLVVCNFTPVVRRDYRIGVPIPGTWEERLNTDAAIYCGSNVGNSGQVEATDVGWHGMQASLLLTIPPLATIVLTPVSH